MKKPWKILMGRRIHRTPTGVEVHQNIAYRWLTFGNTAIQTLINRRHPEKSGLPYVQQLTWAVRAQPGITCLLGLGGAGVAHVLAPYLDDTPLIAVEQNQDVINLASTYFMTAILSNLTIIQEDAYSFVQQQNLKYQHVLIDLFNATSFPEHCNNADFIRHSQSMLLPNGILAINIANLSEQWLIFNYVRQQFNQCTVIMPVKGTTNLIVLGYNGESVSPLLDLLKQSGLLETLSWDNQWGCVAQMKK